MIFLKKYKRGESGWYAPNLPGEVSFWYDSGRWIYAEEADKAKLKREVLAAFEHDGRQTFKVTGRFPNYDIEEA